MALFSKLDGLLWPAFTFLRPVIKVPGCFQFPRFIRKVVRSVDGDTTQVHGEVAKSSRSAKLLPEAGPSRACPLCRLGLKISYQDVLILRQFMRKDGTVYPKQVTGLCTKQQLIVERLVMQAHWSGLFPTLKPKDFDFKEHTQGYKRFKRYWDSDIDMYSKKLTVTPGSFYYIKRY